jgi:hypothetical protein
MVDTSPQIQKFQVNVANVAAGADLETKIGESPFAGHVTRVAYIPASTLTGANTDSRTLQLFNRGTGGAGTTKVAEKAYTVRRQRRRRRRQRGDDHHRRVGRRRRAG